VRPLLDWEKQEGHKCTHFEVHEKEIQ